MDELDKIFADEANYAEEMQTRVMPYINARRYDGYVAGYDGKPLHYVRYLADSSAATVIISHGFTESAENGTKRLITFLTPVMTFTLSSTADTRCRTEA